MTIEKLIERLLANKTKTTMARAAQALAESQQAIRLQYSKTKFNEDLKLYIKYLEKHISQKERFKAMATALALVIVDAESTVSEVRRIGIFRASHYEYQSSLISDIVEAILQLRPLLSLHQDRFTYLESVQVLMRLAPSVRHLYNQVAQFLLSRKDVAIKTILVLINQIFYFGWEHIINADSDDPRHYSPEELSEAASLLISMFRNLFKLKADMLKFVDEKSIKSSDETYLNVLVLAAKLNKFRDKEAKIDYLPYKVILDGNTVCVSSINPDIEMSVRLGYVNSELQFLLRLQTFSSSDRSKSLREFINQWDCKETIELLVPIVDKPIKRLTLRLPNFLGVFDKLFSKNLRLKEEIQSLLRLDVDSFDSREKPPIYKISDLISSDDIFKIQRYFCFISCLYQKRLEGFTNPEKRLMTYRSTVLVMSRDEIVNHLNTIFQNDQKTNELINYLTLDIRRSFVDLQYTPFIVIGDCVAIAPHLVAASNLVRNIIVANKLRNKLVSGDIDPMQKATADALKQAGFKVEVEAKVRISGNEIEIDIIAWRDNILFLLECKNAYLPCNVHEMRNSYEHIEKASRQLERRGTIFQKLENQKLLFQKLNWNIQPTTAIHTGIITANRVFHGAEINGHPVRYAQEFINVVLRGFIASGDKKFSFWAGPTFQTPDLVSYLKGETLIADQMSSLVPVTREYMFGRYSLKMLTYELCSKTMHEKITANYPAIDGSNNFT